MFRSFGFSVIAAMGIIAATQSAVAAPHAQSVDVRSMKVSLRGLDLSTPAHVRVLLTRLQEAAYYTCGGDPRLNLDYGIMGPRIEKRYQDCRNNAVARAVDKVNAPLLTQISRNEGTPRLARATTN